MMRAIVYSLNTSSRPCTRSESRPCNPIVPPSKPRCEPYESLSEKDRRRYAAIEAQKFGRGGFRYIARVLGCDRHTIAQGMQELTDPNALQQTRIRRAGGGRKSSLAVLPGLEAAFLHVLEDYTAGSPMKAEVKWTNLTHQEIADRLTEYGFHVSVTVVKQLLKTHDFVRRKAQKRNVRASVPTGTRSLPRSHTSSRTMPRVPIRS